MRENLIPGLYVGMLLIFFTYTIAIYTWPTRKEIAETPDPTIGKMLWQQKNCVACHQIYGLGGFLGPDLTNVYSAANKGPNYIKAYVQAGTTVMPSFDFSERELESLVAFFKQVDASGKADPKIFKRNVIGTIEYQ